MTNILYRFFAALVLTLAAAGAIARPTHIDEAVLALRELTDQRVLWSDPARLAALRTQLETLRADGLEPGHYGLDVLQVRSADACTESLATRALLHALDDLRHGRLDMQAFEALWRDHSPLTHESPQALARRALAALEDPATAFAAARPDLPAYQRLREHLAGLLAPDHAAEPAPLPESLTLRAGMRHPAIALLRERLAWHGLGAAAAGAADHFDEALLAQVKRFQHGNHLQPDGVVGRATRAALNLTLAQRIARTRANLERWRWLAHELQPTQVRVDVAAAELSYLRDGALRWFSRVQVGRNERATPLLASHLNRITLNPPWVVPPTILREDKLPAIRANPQVLVESRMRVLAPDGHELDPATIDWNAPGPITLRQDPGPFNALGQVVLRFPNPFSIYLHDTPSQMQFSSWQRTFSSGCVRVERAMELAELLLEDASGVDAEAVATALGHGDTRELRLRQPVPILIGYWTADAAPGGELRWHADSYGHDARIAAALEQAAPHPLPQCSR